MIIILCTLPTNNYLFISNFSKNLIKNKLAACITVLPNSSSYYFGENKIETITEAQLLIKTKKSLQKLIFKKIKELHPYKIPELITLSADNVESNYLSWINKKLFNNSSHIK